MADPDRGRDFPGSADPGGCGLLVVRTKPLDFATMTTISLVMLYVAYTIDPLGTS
jgi:hypothetical protein